MHVAGKHALSQAHYHLSAALAYIEATSDLFENETISIGEAEVDLLHARLHSALDIGHDYMEQIRKALVAGLSSECEGCKTDALYVENLLRIAETNANDARKAEAAKLRDDMISSIFGAEPVSSDDLLAKIKAQHKRPEPFSAGTITADKIKAQHERPEPQRDSGDETAEEPASKADTSKATVDKAISDMVEKIKASATAEPEIPAAVKAIVDELTAAGFTVITRRLG